jgi:uncharacterized heparinase superfamily protein
MRLEQLRVLISTTRHLRRSQITGRLRQILRRNWNRLTRQKVKLTFSPRLSSNLPLWLGPTLEDALLPQQVDFKAAIARGAAVASGLFTFLSQTVRYPSEPDWDESTVPRLWRFELHSFSYLADLFVWSADGHRAEAFRTFRSLAESWIRRNERLQGDGWHPYTVSLRVANWCQSFFVFENELGKEADFADLLRRSTYAQARFLSRNLEFDIGGNHLIENARALIIAGFAFAGDEAGKWLAQGSELLKAEIREQILEDGGHFERVPGYHSIVTRNLLELSIIFRRNQRPMEWLEDAAARMLAFLDQLSMPDGGLPLLKDTTFDGIPPTEILAAAAVTFSDSRWKRCEKASPYCWLLFGSSGIRDFGALRVNETPRKTAILEESGFIVLCHDNDWAILDVGKAGPDRLPAHAHADMFSFELASDGVRFIVDSGVYTYEAGPWRQHFRSTRAHNTVAVNGQDQSEMWSSFRVGRRAVPQMIGIQCDAESMIAQVQHDGYRRRAGVVHRRTFAWISGILVIAEEMIGLREAEAVSHLHLHPDVQVESSDGPLWCLRRDARTRFVSAFGQVSARLVKGELNPIQGWYSERFGAKTSNPTLEIRSQRDPFFGYLIAASPLSVSKVADRLAVLDDGKLLLGIDLRTRKIERKT